MTIHDDLRERLQANVIEYKKRDLATLRRTEWSQTFEQLMRNRLMMGYFRYGSVDRNEDLDYDRVQSIIQRIKKYRETGNKEYLVDIANLSMLEFLHSSHPNSHFEAIDDGDHVQKIK